MPLEVTIDSTTWAARLVFSPAVWLGIIVAGGSAALFFVSGLMRSRGIGVRGKAAERATRKAERLQAKGAVPVSSSKPKRHESDLDDMDDIEAILKKHGI